MIQNFRYCNSSNICINIFLGAGMFNDISKELFNKFYDGSLKQTEWDFLDRHIVLKSNTQSVLGYPSLDKNYVIAVYHGDDGEYLSPGNAVIYHADGSLHKVLIVPPLISDAAKRWGIYKRKSSEGLFFTNVCWKLTKKYELALAMQIEQVGGRGIFKEVRILDPQSGTFGECIYGAIEYK